MKKQFEKDFPSLKGIIWLGESDKEIIEKTCLDRKKVLEAIDEWFDRTSVRGLFYSGVDVNALKEELKKELER